MEKSKIMKNIIDSSIKLYNSAKDIELNNILEKISNKLRITNNEVNFLKNYDNIKDNDIKDYSMLSKLFTEIKIKELLDKNIKIICNLKDRYGSIKSQITMIEGETIHHKCGDKLKLKDNNLYNLIYNIKRNEYSLESAGEYYEKIENENSKI